MRNVCKLQINGGQTLLLFLFFTPPAMALMGILRLQFAPSLFFIFLGAMTIFSPSLCFPVPTSQLCLKVAFCEFVGGRGAHAVRAFCQNLEGSIYRIAFSGIRQFCTPQFEKKRKKERKKERKPGRKKPSWALFPYWGGTEITRLSLNFFYPDLAI